MQMCTQKQVRSKSCKRYKKNVSYQPGNPSLISCRLLSRTAHGALASILQRAGGRFLQQRTAQLVACIAILNAIGSSVGADLPVAEDTASKRRIEIRRRIPATKQALLRLQCRLVDRELDGR